MFVLSTGMSDTNQVSKKYMFDSYLQKPFQYHELEPFVLKAY